MDRHPGSQKTTGNISNATIVTNDTYKMTGGLLNENNHSTSGVNKESFDIIKVIGRGSFGKVYLIEKKDSKELFAMKTLKKDQILRKNQK